MVLQPTDSNLEELVEPRGEDGEELHTLEKGKGDIRGEVQEAIGEVEPGELTVEEPVRARDEALRRCDIDLHDPRRYREVVQPLAIAPRVKQRRRSELGLLIVVVVVITLAYMLASLGTYNTLPPNALEFIGVIAALALAVHVANRFLAPEADPVIMPVVLMLNGIGFVMIYRLDASPQVAADAPWHYQAIWTVLGVVAYVVTLLIVRRSRDLERYRYMLVFGALILLVLPLAPYLGNTPESRLSGVRLWIRLGPITFQPVEVAKLMLVVFFASYFVEKSEMLSLSTRRVGNRLLPGPAAPRPDRGRVGGLGPGHPLRARHRLLASAVRDVHRDVVGGDRALDLCRRWACRLRRRYVPRRAPAVRQDVDRPAGERMAQSLGALQTPTDTRPSKESSLSAGAACPDRVSVSAPPTTSPSPTATSSSRPSARSSDCSARPRSSWASCFWSAPGCEPPSAPARSSRSWPRSASPRSSGSSRSSSWPG